LLIKKSCTLKNVCLNGLKVYWEFRPLKCQIVLSSLYQALI